MATSLSEAPMPPPDAVHARLLFQYADLVDALGGDAGTLMARVGIRPPLAPHQASYREVIALLELSAAELRCPDFGLRLAMLQGGLRVSGPLGAVMRHSSTFGEALDYVVAHNAAHSLAARVWRKRLPREHAIFIGHDILLDGIARGGQTIEQILMLGHLGAIEMTDGQTRVRRVHFRHQPTMPPALYRRRFGCDVLFGQKGDGVFFSENDLASPIVDRDAQAYRAAVTCIETRFGQDRPPLHTRVRGIVMQHLGTPRCTNERISSELDLHSRVLHRRLAAEGTSFQKIKNEVRRDLMVYYLEQTDMEFTRISERLGFAEQSVMTRCCHRWLSASPTAIRKAGGGSARAIPATVQIGRAKG